LLWNYKGYKKFAKNFVKQRLSVVNPGAGTGISNYFDPTEHLDNIDSKDFYKKTLDALGVQSKSQDLARRLKDALTNTDSKLRLDVKDAYRVSDILILDLPVLLQRLNVLLFCKRYRKVGRAIVTAQTLREASEKLAVCQAKGARGTYATAYQHAEAEANYYKQPGHPAKQAVLL